MRQTPQQNLGGFFYINLFINIMSNINLTDILLELKEPEVSDIMSKIRSCLDPELLEPKYRKQNEKNPMFGHCYVASEALYHLLKSKKLKGTFEPYHALDMNGIVHHWLQNDTGKILDVTKSQYTKKSKRPPYKYKEGTHRAFIGGGSKPSKRAKDVIKCVRGKLRNN